MARTHAGRAALFSLVALLGGVPFAWRYWTSAAAASNVAANELAPALIRAGLDPRALAAAGLTANQTTAVVTAFEAAYAANPTRLSTADANYAALRSSTDALARKIQAGLASQEEAAQYASDKTALTAAEAERADCIEDLFVAATANLGSESIATLNRMRANKGWELPIEFSAADRSQTDWVKLRDALANEKISARYGEEADATQQTFLASARATSAVAAAKSALDANAASITTAWNAAIAE